MQSQPAQMMELNSTFQNCFIFNQAECSWNHHKTMATGEKTHFYRLSKHKWELRNLVCHNTGRVGTSRRHLEDRYFHLSGHRHIKSHRLLSCENLPSPTTVSYWNETSLIECSSTRLHHTPKQDWNTTEISRLDQTTHSPSILQDAGSSKNVKMLH